MIYISYQTFINIEINYKSLFDNYYFFLNSQDNTHKTPLCVYTQTKRLTNLKSNPSMKIESYDHVLKWSYKLASIWVKENLVPLGINSSRKFEAYKREKKYLPKNFPRKPDDYFKKQKVWKGWPDFFGKDGNHAGKDYYSYKEAAKICQRMNIRNSIEYRSWKNRPTRLPARPDQYYKEVWQSWEIFLGDNYKLPERKVASKLNERDVRIIKHQLDLGISGSILAKNFGVSEMQISRIKNGENWDKIVL